MDEYQKLKRKGFKYLFKGIIFLLICLALGQLAVYLELPFAGLIAESTIIIGWVAVWRPAEIFLYELPELKEELKNKEKLSEK